jgi:DNA-binding MurR/RpiR family transcriptional regulator
MVGVKSLCQQNGAFGMGGSSMALVSFEELRAEISAKHAEFSPRLQQIAEFALAHPNDMALETVASVATRAGVQPSTLIRFAKTLGFEGFSDMQRVFRTRLVDRVPTYTERLKALAEDPPQLNEQGDSMAVLEHFIASGTHALEHLRQEVRREDFERAIDLLAGPGQIYIMGQRRAFPVASYFAYTLSHLGRRMILIDGVGGLTQQQARGMTDRDVLLAISFKPYAPETIDIARAAAGRGVAVLSLTDAPLSPLVPVSTVALEVEDAAVKGFRSLTATMCLAVSLVVALGRRVERQGI